MRVHPDVRQGVAPGQGGGAPPRAVDFDVEVRPAIASLALHSVLVTPWTSLGAAVRLVSNG